MVQKSVVMIMVLTLFSKVLGFTRDIILAYYYGVSAISDAFLIALIIPSVLFTFIASGISNSYIPIYSNLESKYGKDQVNYFTNNIINLLLAISTFFVIVVLLFTEPIVKIFASGFDGETLMLAVSFTRITIVSVYFTGLIHIFTAFLEIHKSYVVPSVMGLPFNLGLMLGIMLSSTASIYLLPVGKVAAIILQFLFLLVFVNKKGFKYRPILDLKNKQMRQIMLLSAPIILGTSVEQINKLVDRTLASTITVGGVSALNYANQLNLFIQGIFVMSITAVFYPIISKMAANNNLLGLKKSLTKTIVVIGALLIPTTVGTLIFSKQIVSILFARGAFTNEAALLTSDALFFYSIGMVGFGISIVLTKTFYSLQDTKTPMKNAVLAMVLNIILNLILSRYLGVGGLALATSISSTFCTILLFVSLRNKIGFFEFKDMLLKFLKITVSSMIMGVIVKFVYDAIIQEINSGLALLSSILIGIVVYSVIVYFLKVREIEEFLVGIRRIGKKSSRDKHKKSRYSQAK